MPDETDRFDGDNCYIQVNPSGGVFHLYGDDPAEIRIGDVANAISKQCRFTGHLVGDFWYSVAEHCCLVARLVALMGGSKEEKFAALMHDTPEAYLADIAAPFKREIGRYYETEALVWRRIAAKFGIPETLPWIVKKADWLALFIEARWLVVPSRPETLHDWVGWAEHGEQALALEIKPSCWPHHFARHKFLEAFEALRP